MAPSSKSSTAATARRKSNKGGEQKIVTFKLPREFLQSLEPAPPAPPATPVKQEVKEIKEDSPSKDSTSTLLNTVPVAAPSTSAEKPVESAANTPVPNGTPLPSLMPPPLEGPKKKGVKRSAGVALGPDGLPKPRGKPGPKKKARLEDGSIDHSSTAPRAANGTVHKLGPKANQGAINAGLRALDRSGKPCRKWQKGVFKVKSFTGVTWELPRWKAPPKVGLEVTSGDSASGDSSKENKENSQMESEKSEKSNNAGIDVEMASTGNLVSSPAPSTPQTSAPAAVASAIPATPTVAASA